MKEHFIIEIDLVDKTFTKTVATKVRINTVLSGKTFIFSASIPKHIFDYIKDTGDKKYNTIKHKKERYDFSKEFIFKQKLKSNTLSFLLSELETVSIDCLSNEKFNQAQSTKKIAIFFNHSNKHQKDQHNFSYMGKKFNMNFQFFNVYEIDTTNILGPRKQYKTRECMADIVEDSDKFSSVRASNRKKEWYFFNHDISKDFNVIDWTQDAEDFLNDVQNNFADMADKLNFFLSDIDNVKMKELISNGLKQLKA